MEIYEFHHLIVNGMGPDRSGFLSAFFALVGTHGLHVTSGLIWMAVLMVQIARRGLTSTNRTRIMCLSLFWHFLDVVWICVFTVVYLMGRCNESFYRSQRRVPWQRKNLHDRLYPVDHSDGDSVLDGDDRAASPAVILGTILAMAVVQVLVHLVCFLHMNTKSDEGWNMTAFVFTVLIIAILVVGSIWIMWNLNYNMMMH